MSPLKRSNNIAARMGRWSANHWKTAVFGWLAFVAASVVIGAAVGTKYLEASDLAVGEARTADTLIESGFPAAADEQGEIVLIQSKTLEAGDPGFKAAIADVVKTLDGFPQVRKLDSPLEAGHADLISADRHSAMVQFSPKGTYEEAALYIETLEAAVAKVDARHPGFEIDELGGVSTKKAVDEAFGGMLAKAGMIALPLTLVILLLVFGSAVAALVPLLLAITAVIATTSLVALPSQLFAVDESIAEVILLIGLAVGIDYSLFYLRREREERAAGRSEHAALEAAAATSGRAVLVSGITVLIAMAGMFLSGDKTFMSFSIGTMMVVAIAMIGSLTVLPAILAKLGDRVEKGRLPFLHRLRRKNGESRFWGAILDRVLRRPVVSAIAATAVLVALTVPAFSLNTTTSGIDDISIPEIEPFKKFEEAFPGGSDPAVVAIKAEDVRAEPVREAIAELETACPRERPDEDADRGRGEPRQRGREGLDPARGRGDRRQGPGGPGDAARGASPHDRRQGRGRRLRRHRSNGARQGLGGVDAEDGTARLRVRSHLRLHDPAGFVPLDRGRAEGDRPQPALCRSRIRPAGHALPMGLG